MIAIFLFLSAARVVKDRASGWSKGFGFVRYSTLEGAAAGIEGMDGKVTMYTFKQLRTRNGSCLIRSNLLLINAITKHTSAPRYVMFLLETYES